MDIMSTGEFEPRTVDTVERLLDLLDEMERHPALKGKLALHGGTAINLFSLSWLSLRFQDFLICHDNPCLQPPAKTVAIAEKKALLPQTATIAPV